MRMQPNSAFSAFPDSVHHAEHKQTYSCLDACCVMIIDVSPSRIATFTNSEGNFELADGSFGNPGCDECGEVDAVVKINGVYYCTDGLEDWLSNFYIAFARARRPDSLMNCRGN